MLQQYQNSEKRDTYTVPEIAEILHISLRGAYNLCAAGEFPVLRFGKKNIRIPKSSFNYWFDTAAQ